MLQPFFSLQLHLTTLPLSTAPSSDHTSVDFSSPSSMRPSKQRSLLHPDLATSPLLHDQQDIDEDKYKRKSALEMLLRWGRTLVGPSARRKRGTRAQRLLMTAVLAVLAFLTFIVVMSYLGRRGDYSDPMLEPMNNPNIHVGID